VERKKKREKEKKRKGSRVDGRRTREGRVEARKNLGIVVMH
jgi:hypothetical protein